MERKKIDDCYGRLVGEWMAMRYRQTLAVAEANECPLCCAGHAVWSITRTGVKPPFQWRVEVECDACALSECGVSQRSADDAFGALLRVLPDHLPDVL
jgi:hypothetical protein